MTKFPKLDITLNLALNHALGLVADGKARVSVALRYRKVTDTPARTPDQGDGRGDYVAVMGCPPDLIAGEISSVGVSKEGNPYFRVRAWTRCTSDGRPGFACVRPEGILDCQILTVEEIPAAPEAPAAPTV